MKIFKCCIVTFLIFLSSVAGLFASGLKAETNKEKALALLSSLYNGDKASLAFVDETLKQHDPRIADAKLGLSNFLDSYTTEKVKVNNPQIIHILEDGDYIVIHNYGLRLGQNKITVAFDIFKFTQGLIVEYWNNITPLAGRNKSGHTQIDGTKLVTNKNDTEHNKEFIKKYMQEVLLVQNYTNVEDYFAPNFVEHGEYGSDGIAELKNSFNFINKGFFTVLWQKNMLVLGEGDFVLVASTGKYGFFHGGDTALYDLYRIENDRITEHWFLPEAIPEKKAWKNSNGKF